MQVGGKESAMRREVMELQEINGRLQLQLKCAKQQVKLYEFWLVAEHDKSKYLKLS